MTTSCSLHSSRFPSDYPSCQLRPPNSELLYSPTHQRALADQPLRTSHCTGSQAFSGASPRLTHFGSCPSHNSRGRHSHSCLSEWCSLQLCSGGPWGLDLSGPLWRCSVHFSKEALRATGLGHSFKLGRVIFPLEREPAAEEMEC